MKRLIEHKKFIPVLMKFSEIYNPHKMHLISQNGLSWQEYIKINPVELF